MGGAARSMNRYDSCVTAATHSNTEPESPDGEAGRPVRSRGTMPALRAQSSVESPSSRLVRGLEGDSHALADLFLDSRSTLTAHARRLARDFPSDLIEEAVSETWLMVVASGPAAVRRVRAPDTAYLVGVLRHAVRRVRANNRPPRVRSRGCSGVHGIRFDGDNPLHVIAEARIAQEHFERAEHARQSRMILGCALRRASTPVRRAALLILLRDLSIVEAARSVGMNRMTLTRAFQALGKAA
jgi:DNA-directed RNA polymerase specialized sigma24 family protein